MRLLLCATVLTLLIFQRRIIRWLFTRDQPATPTDWTPRYQVNGQWVEVTAWPTATRAETPTGGR